MKPPLTVGIDLGATKLVAGLVDGAGALLLTLREPTRVAEYGAGLDAIEALVTRLQDEAKAADGRVQAVGVGAAAFLDADRDRIVHAANLGWRQRELRADLQDRLDLPVTLANDADAAAWGEYVHGAGAGRLDLVLVTLGTGVGSGIVVGGQLLTGAHGLAGELGHLPLVPDGRPCPCGGRGCLEQYASGKAVRRAARVAAAAQPRAAQRLLALAADDVEAIDGPHVVVAARQGDPVALAALDEAGRWLGRGAAHVVTLLDPAVVLVAGGLAAAGELILAPARAAYAEHAAARFADTRPELRLAETGAWAGVIGAAALAR